MTASEVALAWRQRYGDNWRGHGHGYSAPEYALVVAQHRLGKRPSLSFGYVLAHGPVSERQARAQLRAEVDAVIATWPVADCRVCGGDGYVGDSPDPYENVCPACKGTGKEA